MFYGTVAENIRFAFAVDRGLWAIYLPEGGETYRLFRALGTAAVFVLAALLASSAAATTRELFSRIEISRREVAFGLVLAVFLALSFVAVPLNLYTVDDPTAGIDNAEPIEIEDYTVFYAEDVENQFIPAVPVPGVVNRTGGDGRVEASGLIVVSERRSIWWQEISAQRLRSSGAATIRLGGLTWNEDLRATRETWAVAGGNQTHHVRLGLARADERDVVFRAEPARANTVIDGRNITVAPAGDGFEVVVSRNNDSIGTASIPGVNETARAGGLKIVREDRSLFVERDETRVRVARKAR
jgi:hypothetical protein